LAIDDTAEGVDIRLRAFGDVADVQQRARDAAAMYGPGAHRGEGHDGQHERGGHHGLGLASLGIQIRASEEDTSEGAVVHVAALDEEDRPRLQKVMHLRADDARRGGCP
jgi:hypothetical protein